MALGDITVGKAPGANQVNLGQMRGNLNNVLAPGMLGNTVANPMSGVIAAGGDAGLGYQNAIANSRMMDIALQAKQQALQQEEQQYEMDQQKPGLTDLLGLGLSGFGAIRGIQSRDQMNSLMEDAAANDPAFLQEQMKYLGYQ